MKTLILILLTITFSASAQQHPDMESFGGPDMQKMMQARQKVQVCFEKIDKKKMAKIQQKAMKFANKIRSLCLKGKQDQAKKESDKRAKKLMTNPVMKEIQKCSKIMADAELETNVKEVDICEEFQDGKISPSRY